MAKPFEHGNTKMQISKIIYVHSGDFPLIDSILYTTKAVIYYSNLPCLYSPVSKSFDKSNVYIALMWIGNNKSDIFFLHSTMFTARVRSIESKFLQIPD